MPVPVQITGLVRFSYVAKGGWKKMGADPAGTAAMLYDPARLDRRFRLFEAMCLPSLEAQTDRDMSVILLTGDGLPPAALDRLHAAAERIPGGRVVTLPPKHHYNAMKRAFAEVPPDGRLLVTFRLDDDDALATDYAARLRTLAGTLMEGRDTPLSISFNRGLYVEPGGRGLFDAVERTPLSVGTALCGAGGDNVYARNHRFLPEYFDTFAEARTPMWIRTIHPDNDSKPHVQGHTGEMDDAGIDAALTRFVQDRAALDAL